MKTLKNILKIGALAGFMAFTSCQKDNLDDPYIPPHFTNVYEKEVAGNLERPSGLSSDYISEESGTKSAKGYNSDMVDLGIFMQGPLFYDDGRRTILAKTKNPKLSNISGSLSDLIVNSSQELDIKNLFLDFNSYLGYSPLLPLSDSLYRPVGLTLDILIKDGSVLLSSNSSDKIFKIGLSGLEVYLQDSKLEGITDMIKGKDGKIYAVEAPKISYNDSSIVESPKKVISLDGLVIGDEFELPSDVNSHPWGSEPHWWTNATFIEKLKIVENSFLGKRRFGAEFYISDLLERKIYKVDAQKNVSVLAENLRGPSSLNVDLAGNIYYTTSPIWLSSGSLSDIEYPTELCLLNPETGVSSVIHKFDEKDIHEYLSTGAAINIEYNNKIYTMPVGFNVTNLLFESLNKLNFLFTNSHQGTLKLVTIDK